MPSFLIYLKHLYLAVVISQVDVDLLHQIKIDRNGRDPTG